MPEISGSVLGLPPDALAQVGRVTTPGPCRAQLSCRGTPGKGRLQTRMQISRDPPWVLRRITWKPAPLFEEQDAAPAAGTGISPQMQGCHPEGEGIVLIFRQNRHNGSKATCPACQSDSTELGGGGGAELLALGAGVRGGWQEHLKPGCQYDWKLEHAD